MTIAVLAALCMIGVRIPNLIRQDRLARLNEKGTRENV